MYPIHKTDELRMRMLSAVDTDNSRCSSLTCALYRPRMPITGHAGTLAVSRDSLSERKPKFDWLILRHGVMNTGGAGGGGYWNKRSSQIYLSQGNSKRRVELDEEFAEGLSAARSRSGLRGFSLAHT
ncbi:hypothetical protein B0H16DRAFT_1696088 [Mycena metata]|uniref:Uncharacterized protein n=1 Tax=Mycena metata TaxID=1033252 RepID=A0AAD7MUI5_9AGAR|nr:hypothetical protein B0H16DRAFT_1696088 [Mycena metata]